MKYSSYYENNYDIQQIDVNNIDTDNHLVKDIRKAIIGEVHAYNFYQRLAELAPNEQYRQIILSIQQDEATHYHWFTMILCMIGGQLPQIPRGDLPREFVEGVRAAICDELEAADLYQDIAYRATAYPIRLYFTHASLDEQQHALWFQAMLRS